MIISQLPHHIFAVQFSLAALTGFILFYSLFFKDIILNLLSAVVARPVRERQRATQTGVKSLPGGSENKHKFHPIMGFKSV